MSQTSALNYLEPLIRSAFADGRCGEYYLVDVEITPTKHITVFVDGDEGVSLDACTQISRILESILDEDTLLGGIYELEVSSPGINRPLRFPRQYLKHTGRTLKLELNNGQVIEGVLTNTSHDMITVDVRPKDKKSKAESKEIPFDEIKEAYVTIQFGRSK